MIKYLVPPPDLVHTVSVLSSVGEILKDEAKIQKGNGIYNGMVVEWYLKWKVEKEDPSHLQE